MTQDSTLRNAVATQQRQHDANDHGATIGQMLASPELRAEVMKALPGAMPPERFLRLAMTAFKKEPKLRQCTPESLIGAVMQASALGLEVGVLDQAYLAPFNNKVKDENGRIRYQMECQLLIGYEGLIDLFYRHPLAQYIDTHVVYEADEFRYQYGTEQYLVHKPAPVEPGDDPGKPVFYYAIASLTNGAHPFLVLTPAQVKAIRGKEGANGGIADTQKHMERKTVIRQLSKYLPRSTEFATAVNSDGHSGRDFYQAAVVEREAEQADPPAVEAAPERKPRSKPAALDEQTGEVGEQYAPPPEVVDGELPPEAGWDK